jgi:hemoglobin-like flavoprotein
MTPEQVTLVKSSFGAVSGQPDMVANLFYTRLFELDPPARALFKGDMTEQGRKLMQMIGVAVAALDRLETIVPAVQNLGRRHAGYGVQESQYDTVGSALLWTLEQGLGPAFDADTRAAWTTVYGVLAQTMKDAARTAP